MTAAERIRARAAELGFNAVGIADVAPLEAQKRYEAWLARDMHGEMHYLASERHRERRADPARILPQVRTVICVALCHPAERNEAGDWRLGRIARYAAGEDYHRVMRDKLRALQQEVTDALPGARSLWYADTGPLLERAWAERAGLGWIGKHTGLISPRIGSWFMLGEILVDREITPDVPLGKDHCGTCNRCIEACPTGAIVAPRNLDARLCISYLTIELRSAIPRDLRPLIGDWIFGCDVCQDVCPWNRFAPPAREARLHARSLGEWTLERFLDLDEDGFRTLFADSPIRRARREGFLRNVCVALGNRGDVAAMVPLARALSGDVHPLVRGHAAWALSEIIRSERTTPATDREKGLAALEAAARSDPDAGVRDEARAALQRCT